LTYNSIKNIQKEQDDLSIRARFTDNLALQTKTYLSQSSLMFYKLYIIGQLKPVSNSTWLDICCGAGSNSIILASKYCCNVVSFDISLEALRRGQKIKNHFGLSKIDFVNADVFHLPFREDIFDNAIATQSLSYYILEEQKILLKNLSLCFKQDALFILSDATKGSSAYHLIESSTYVSLLKGLGFSIIENREWGYGLYQFLNKIRSKFVWVIPRKKITRTSTLLYKFVSLYTSIVFKVAMIENHYRKRGGFLFYIIAKKSQKKPC
jgi:SAM-dependent methyltransferase